MSISSQANLGYWTDHDRRLPDKAQVLATDMWSRVMTGVVAVCLTLTTPYIFELVIWLFNPLWKSFGSRAQPREDDESQQLLRNSSTGYGTTSTPPDTGESRQSEGPEPVRLDGPSFAAEASQTDQERNSVRGIGSRLAIGSSSRETVWSFLRALAHGEVRDWKDQSLGLLLSIVLFIFFVAQATFGILSARIASDKIGISSSSHCGVWQFDENAGPEASDVADLSNYEKEYRASQYARTCYDKSQLSPSSCELFYNRSISFSTKTHQPCPFASSHMCLDGLYSAVTFDTGMVDSSIIGVNSPDPYKFRRTSNCAPLNMSDPYIQKTSQVNETYRYNYGSKGNVNFTLQTSGHPFDWQVPVYKVK